MLNAKGKKKLILFLFFYSHHCFLRLLGLCWSGGGTAVSDALPTVVPVSALCSSTRACFEDLAFSSLGGTTPRVMTRMTRNGAGRSVPSLLYDIDNTHQGSLFLVT